MMRTYDPVEGSFGTLLSERAASAELPTYLLLQGYPYTGFAFFENGKLRLPSGFETVVDNDWDLYFDVRVFDGKQEWHYWRAGGKWRVRYTQRGEWTGIERIYVLWGGETGSTNAGLFRCDSEDRGAKVYLPASAVHGIPAPVGLRMLLRTEFEHDTGIAGITDAMIIGFTSPQPCKPEEAENDD